MTPPPQQPPMSSLEMMAGGKRLWVELEPNSNPVTVDFWDVARELVFNFVLFDEKSPVAEWVMGPEHNGAYPYEITLTDGRKWKQEVIFDAGNLTAEPHMTFDVKDEWRVSEFAAHRPIRDIVVRMVQRHGLKSLSWGAA